MEILCGIPSVGVFDSSVKGSARSGSGAVVDAVDSALESSGGVLPAYAGGGVGRVLRDAGEPSGRALTYVSSAKCLRIRMFNLLAIQISNCWPSDRVSIPWRFLEAANALVIDGEFHKLTCNLLYKAPRYWHRRNQK